MKYAKIESVGGAIIKYPYTFKELRRDNPKVSYPRNPTDIQLIGWGVHPVTLVPKPPYDVIMENLSKGTPVWYGNILEDTWIVTPASAEEIAERTANQEAEDSREEVRQDAFVQNFIQMTPKDISSYVDSNMTDLPSTRALVKKIAVMLLILARKEFEGRP